MVNPQKKQSLKKPISDDVSDLSATPDPTKTEHNYSLGIDSEEFDSCDLSERMAAVSDEHCEPDEEDIIILDDISWQTMSDSGSEADNLETFDKRYCDMGDEPYLKAD